MAEDREQSPAVPRRPGRAQALVHRLAQLTACVAACLWLVSLLAPWFRVCELLTHFALQYFGGLLVCSVWFAARRNWRDLAFSLPFALLTAWQVVPWYLPPEETPGKSVGQLKIISANVFRDNQDAGALLEFVRREDPDLLVLMEVNGRWMDACESLRDRLPYRIADARGDNFGIAVYSKLEMKRIPIRLGWIPSIVVQVPQGLRTVSVVCTHPMPPMNDQLYRFRNEQFQAIANWVKRQPHPAIVAGDLNVSMWSPNYQQFVDDARLHNARRGMGVVPTYHTSLGVAAIPIDHILHTEEFRVREFYRGPDIGSDHWPVVGVLELVE